MGGQYPIHVRILRRQHQDAVCHANDASKRLEGVNDKRKARHDLVLFRHGRTRTAAKASARNDGKKPYRK